MLETNTVKTRERYTLHLIGTVHARTCMLLAFPTHLDLVDFTGLCLMYIIEELVVIICSVTSTLENRVQERQFT